MYLFIIFLGFMVKIALSALYSKLLTYIIDIIRSRMTEYAYFWVNGHSFVPLSWKGNFVSSIIKFYLNTGICMDYSGALINFLDTVILITGTLGIIRIATLGGIHCKRWVYFYGCIFWICHSCMTCWEIISKPTISMFFKGVVTHFLLSCINSLRPSDATWWQQLWRH